MCLRVLGVLLVSKNTLQGNHLTANLAISNIQLEDLSTVRLPLETSKNHKVASYVEHILVPIPSHIYNPVQSTTFAHILSYSQSIYTQKHLPQLAHLLIHPTPPQHHTLPSSSPPDSAERSHSTSLKFNTSADNYSAPTQHHQASTLLYSPSPVPPTTHHLAISGRLVRRS